jgi:cell division protein FtsI/penicillin-binding protein 2
MRRRVRRILGIEGRANRILHLIGVAMLLILLRVWHLAVVQHERKLEGSRRAQKKIIIERPERGNIVDRFGLLMATNRARYDVKVLYGPIQEMPYSLKGKHVRRDYVERLAGWLGSQLGLGTREVEDLIYARAAPMPQVPCLIKEGVDEELYSRLKGAAREWPGLVVERVPVRVYPMGKVGCHLVGYLGAVSASQMEAMATEMNLLKEYLAQCEAGESLRPPEGVEGPFEARMLLQQMQERAISAAELVGRGGVEGKLDRELRGYRGQQLFCADARGRRLDQLPGSTAAISGKQVTLTISAELQETAEQLLAHNERLRDGRSVRYTLEDRSQKVLRQPWIKGGAIIAIDPNTGELLACASYPRFDPNDFVAQRQEQIHKWLEDPIALGAIWDGISPLEREIYDWKEKKYLTEKLDLSWEAYLGQILPENHSARQALGKLRTIGAVVQLLATPEAEWSLVEEPKERQILLRLCKLLVDPARIGPRLLQEVSGCSLAQWRGHERAVVCLASRMEESARQLFHALHFESWRSQQGAAFLKQQRARERAEKRSARPYVDHLRQEERRQFKEFWALNWPRLCLNLLKGSAGEDPFSAQLLSQRELVAKVDSGLREWLLQLPSGVAEEALRAMRSFQELPQSEQETATAFCPRGGFGYCRSYAYQDATAQGSIFKLIPSYAAALESYRKQPTTDPAVLNPLTMIDDARPMNKGWQVGQTVRGEVIPQFYKGGRLPRTASSGIGRIDLVNAIEVSSNPYFGMLCVDQLKAPSDLARAARLFCYGRTTGFELPGELPGAIPNDLETNRTGLYATAIGQHTLLATPMQTAIAMSALANGGHLLKPQLIKQIAGRDRTWSLTSVDRQFAYWQPLSRIGIDFPLFSAAVCDSPSEQVWIAQPEVRWDIPLPAPVRSLVLEGMRRVVQGPHGGVLPSRLRSFDQERRLLQQYIDLAPKLVGKSSSAEKHESVGLTDPEIYKHTWFTALAFDETLVPYKFEHCDIVVVVYLRYGDFGKEAAPLAATLINKWHEIKEKRLSSCSPSTQPAPQSSRPAQ